MYTSALILKTATFSEWEHGESFLEKKQAMVNQRVCDYAAAAVPLLLGFWPLIHRSAHWIPSSAAPGGWTVPLIVRSASYGRRSSAVPLWFCLFLKKKIIQERLLCDVWVWTNGPQCWITLWVGTCGPFKVLPPTPCEPPFVLRQ